MCCDNSSITTHCQGFIFTDKWKKPIHAEQLKVLWIITNFFELQSVHQKLAMKCQTLNRVYQFQLQLLPVKTKNSCQ
jgi:hypothetical protein